MKKKERIDKDHPGSYDEAIKYGSSPDKQFWYICPRYWSLSKGVSLTQEEVDSKKYGKVIPHDAKVVPEGASIYEFTDKKYHTDNDGNYVKHYPGFIKENKHPKGLCLPCCFKSFYSPEQRKRREQCLLDQDEKKDETQGGGLYKRS